MNVFIQWANRLPWLVLAVAALFLGLFFAASLTSAVSKDVDHDSLGQSCQGPGLTTTTLNAVFAVLPVRMARRHIPVKSLMFPPPSQHLERPYAHRAALVMLYRVRPDLLMFSEP